MVDKKKSGGFNIALGGILTALTVVFMYIASFIPGMELTMFAISSFFVAIMVIEAGPRDGLIMFLAAGIIGFVIIPNKIGIAPYLLLFGYYGIAKYYIEKINKLVPELLVKVCLFLITFGIGFFLFQEVFLGQIELPDYPLPVLAVAGAVVFLIYDRIYSIAIMLYINKVKNKIRR